MKCPTCGKFLGFTEDLCLSCIDKDFDPSFGFGRRKRKKILPWDYAPATALGPDDPRWP